MSNGSGSQGNLVCLPNKCDPTKRWIRYCLDYASASGKWNIRFSYSTNGNPNNYYTIATGECTNMNRPSWEWVSGSGSPEISVIASGVSNSGKIVGRFQCSN